MGVDARPRIADVELNLFGPGYGECCVLHMGDNRWVVIDSCIDSKSKRPAALVYLDGLAVDVAECVELIVVTHWHDDHIRGISQVVAACPKAKICIPGALANQELLASIIIFDERHGLRAGSGVNELINVLELCRKTHRPIKRAFSDTLLLKCNAADISHSRNTEIWSLSPSDLQVDEAIKAHRALVPTLNSAKRRAPEREPNHLSVVTIIVLGETAVLLGADLEETGNPGLGWSSIVSSSIRPQKKAIVFKVPHHGSRNGHLESV